MEISNSIKHLIGISAAVAVLTGCTGGASQLTAPSGGTNSVRQTMGGNRKVDTSQSLLTPPGVKPNLHRTIKDEHIVKPNCCAHRKTLFISDEFGGSNGDGAIYMFDYSSGEPFGQVAPPPEGFALVQGGCALANGDVIFANADMSTLDEYNHSGAYVQTIADPGQRPVACAQDPVSGTVAISNVADTTSGPGSLSFWNGSSLSHPVLVPNMNRVLFLGYRGTSGVLYFDGFDSSNIFQYDKYSGGLFFNVGIRGASVEFPGTVQWSAKTKAMNVGDQTTYSAPRFYQVDARGHVMGSTVTACTSSDKCDIVQAFIKGSGLVGPDADIENANRFAYPAGGLPTLNYPAPYVSPVGSAVSSNSPFDGD